MPRSTYSNNSEAQPLLVRTCSTVSSTHGAPTPMSSMASAFGDDALKISMRRPPKDTIYGSGSVSPYAHTPALITPRSPFEEGFPMMFTSPIPSPRPHRLSFSYERHDRHRELHVFLTLLMSVVGAGMLSVPYTFLLVPTWEAVLGIVGVGVSMAITATALLYAHVQLAQDEERTFHIGAGKRFASFQSIAIAAGGAPLGYVVSVVTAIGIYGGCVGCIRIVKDIAPFIISISRTLLNTETLALDQHTLASYLLWGVFLVVVFPLCILKNLSALRVSSYLGFAFSLYLVAAIVYRSFHALEVPALPEGAIAPPPTAAATPTVVVGALFSRVSQSISIYNYAFMMQLNLIPLFIQLRGAFAEPLATSTHKMTRCIFGVSLFCVGLYVAFGVCARRLYGDAIRGNILLNLENDPVMAVPLVAVFLTVILSFPLLFHPLRGVIEELAFAVSIQEIPFSTRLATTAALLLTQLGLAVWVPGIEVVFALTGASSCLLICFAFPVVLFMRLYPWQQKLPTRRRKVLVLGVLWLIVAFFSVIGADATWFLLISK